MEVTPLSGHDTHEHRLESVRGAVGEVVVTRAFTHVPDIHYEDRYAVVEARGGRGAPARVVLRPRIVEAEHAADAEPSGRQTFGKHPAEPDFADAALTVMKLKEGGSLTYAPLNLTGIDAVILRAKPMPGGTLEVRADGPNGPGLATVDIDSTSGGPAGASGVLHGDLLPDLPEGVRAAYHGWRDVRIPLEGATSTDKLYLQLASSQAQGVVLHVDRLEFVGPGVMRRAAER